MHTDDFNPENIGKSAFFTGHRQLCREERPEIEALLFRSVSDAYASGYRRFFCGCALGFDTVAALQTIRLRDRYPDIRLSLAIPCATQAERWSDRDRETYSRILNLADDRTILSPVYYQGAMMARNRFMADRSSLCICWLRYMRGGTASTVRYALQTERITVVNLAVTEVRPSDLLREKPWNCIFTSPSADGNAVTAPLHLSPDRKLTFRDTST